MKKTLKAVVRKKVIFALALSVTIFGGVYGFAATINAGASPLGAGTLVASCQSSGAPQGTYAVAYDAKAALYTVASIKVTGIDAACATKPVSVTLTGADDSNLITFKTTAAGATIALPVSSTISAAQVTGVSIAVG